MKKITVDTAEIQRIVRDYYKQLYASKVDYLEERDKPSKNKPGRNRKYE